MESRIVHVHVHVHVHVCACICMCKQWLIYAYDLLGFSTFSAFIIIINTIIVIPVSYYDTVYCIGLRQEGIYRLSPSLGDVNRLKVAFNTGTLTLTCTCIGTVGRIYLSAFHVVCLWGHYVSLALGLAFHFS